MWPGVRDFGLFCLPGYLSGRLLKKGASICGNIPRNSVFISFLFFQPYYEYHLYHDGSVPIVRLGLYGIVWCLFSLGCAVGVTLGVSFLLYYQVCKNELYFHFFTEKLSARFIS